MSTAANSSARRMAQHPLDAIFRPRSVALVGVSADEKKLTGAPLAILRTVGFPGAVYPVNPRHASIGGLRCFAHYEDIPAVPDVAMIMLPARDVAPALDTCGRHGTRAAVVIGSGFEEAGGDEPVRALLEVCARHGIALVGPNCEGVWSVASCALLTFGSAAKRSSLAHRPIAILSQSGAMGGAVARHLQDSGFGCAYMVSVGNETVLGLLDYLDYMLLQDDVRLVLLFLEGLKDGGRLLELAERARARGVVIVALKAGNSTLGRAATASHTGKIATPFEVYRDVFAQAGIIVVDGLAELIEAAEVLSTLPLPRATDAAQPGVSVYSIPGGTRALTADLCEARGVPLAVFDRATVAALTHKLPEFGYAENPTDITGKILSAPELFDETLGIVARDAGTEALLIQLANRGPHDAARYRAAIEQAAGGGLPTIVSFLGDTLPAPERLGFAAHGVACARDPNHAVRALGWLYAARASLARAARDQVHATAPAPARALDWPGLMAMLGDAGVATPRWALLPAAASASTLPLTYPLALKALPEQALHKTERGLLRLGLATADEVTAAAAQIRTALGMPAATLLAQEMVEGGVECVLAIRRDPDFGAVLTLGSGGVMVELAHDVGHLCLPVDAADVARALERLRLGRLLAGFRGAPPCDRRALVDAVLGLARCFPSSNMAEIEINPLLVRPAGQGVCALDVLARPLSAH